MNCLLSLESWDRRFESHSRHRCLHLFCVCVGSGLATSWSSVQGVLPTVFGLSNWSETKRFTDALCSKVGATGIEWGRDTTWYSERNLYLTSGFHPPHSFCCEIKHRDKLTYLLPLRPDRFWDPPSFLSNGSEISFPGPRMAEKWRWPQSSI
jgi:hypothetical protein